jgi:hypothetical protein
VPVKKYIVYTCVFVVTSVLGLFGSSKGWTIRTDEKILEWGKRKLEGNLGMADRTKRMLIVAVVIIYILAIFPDLPINGVVNSYYMEKLSGTKNFFMRIESVFSNGYKEYPELFVQKEKEEKKKDSRSKSSKNIYLNLNKEGAKGTKIRKKPSAKAEVAGIVKKGDKIVYQNVWKKEGKRYWLKVYLQKKKKNGWLNAQMIEKSQVRNIIIK